MPDDGDDGNSDVGKDINRRAQRRERTDDQNDDRENDKGIGTLECDANKRDSYRKAFFGQEARLRNGSPCGLLRSCWSAALREDSGVPEPDKIIKTCGSEADCRANAYFVYVVYSALPQGA